MLTHMKTSQKGSFEGCWNTITLGCRLSETGNLFVPDQHGRMHLRSDRLKLWPPYTVARGTWEESSETVNLFIAPQLCETVLGRPLATSKLNYHAKYLTGDPLVERLLKALLIDSQGGSAAGPSLGESIIAAIIHRLNETDDLHPMLEERSSYNDGQVTKAKTFIEANISAKINIDDLAGQANLSVRHFCRAFKKSTGSTPYKYILLRRLENAKTLILEGVLSLHEVALKTGFVSQSHLATAFRNAFGMTPSQFRNTLH